MIRFINNLKGEWKTAYNSNFNIVAVSFSDTKICNFLSNTINCAPVQRNQTKQNDGATRPHCVQVYNDYKGGVDIADAGTTRYLYQQKNTRWTKAALLFLLKMTVSNAWRIYAALQNKATGKQISQRHFIELLCTQIANKYNR